MNVAAPDGEIFGPVNVIEVRACKNGYVVTMFYQRGFESDRPPSRGYECRVVEGFDPDRLGAVVASVLRAHALSHNVVIPAVRALP